MKFFIILITLFLSNYINAADLNIIVHDSAPITTVHKEPVIIKEPSITKEPVLPSIIFKQGAESNKSVTMTPIQNIVTVETKPIVKDTPPIKTVVNRPVTNTTPSFKPVTKIIKAVPTTGEIKKNIPLNVNITPEIESRSRIVSEATAQDSVKNLKSNVIDNTKHKEKDSSITQKSSTPVQTGSNEVSIPDGSTESTFFNTAMLLSVGTYLVFGIF